MKDTWHFTVLPFLEHGADNTYYITHMLGRPWQFLYTVKSLLALSMLKCTESKTRLKEEA